MSYHGSHEAKPQSIVHHIGRLGSKIVEPISNHRKRMRTQRKLEGGSVKSCGEETATVSLSGTVHSMHSCQASVAASEDTDDACSFFSDSDEATSDEAILEDNESLFETLNQNEFLTECFVTNGQSDVIFMVHFFSEETSISNSLEETLSIRVLGTRSKCECRRINSHSAPLFTAKLQIDPEQPTLVAIKNGKVLSKLSDISSCECTEVNQWLERTRILQSVASNSFSGLSNEM